MQTSCRLYVVPVLLFILSRVGSLVHDILLRHQNVSNISVCVTAGLVTQDPNRELDIYQVYKTLCDAGYCSYSQRRHDFRTFFLGYLVKVQGISHSCRVI